LIVVASGDEEKGDDSMQAEIRSARMEALFRDVNERIAESAQRFSSDDAQFVCECDDPSCAERIHTTLEKYDDVREDPTKFLLVPGHENDAVEAVVERRPRFNVVAKIKNRLVADTVRRLDPRAVES
jgi:hypothetical protein